MFHAVQHDKEKVKNTFETASHSPKYINKRFYLIITNMRINNITKLVAAALILLSACQNKEEKTPYPELDALVDSVRM